MIMPLFMSVTVKGFGLDKSAARQRLLSLLINGLLEQ